MRNMDFTRAVQRLGFSEVIKLLNITVTHGIELLAGRLQPTKEQLDLLK